MSNRCFNRQLIANHNGSNPLLDSPPITITTRLRQDDGIWPCFFNSVDITFYKCWISDPIIVCWSTWWQSRYVGRNWQEVRERPGGRLPSTPPPLLSYQPARLTLLIRPAASQSLSGWNRLCCCFCYIVHPLPSSLAQAPAGYLFVIGFSHSNLSSSSLQPESLSTWT